MSQCLEGDWEARQLGGPERPSVQTDSEGHSWTQAGFVRNITSAGRKARHLGGNVKVERVLLVIDVRTLPCERR